MSHPFLTIRIFQIVDCRVLPVIANAKEATWKEAVLSQYDKVDQERPYGLDDPNLAIRHAYQVGIHQVVLLGVPRLAFHDVTLWLLIG